MVSQIYSSLMNNELLFLSREHHVARIFEGTGTDDSLKVQHADRGFCDHVKNNNIPKRVMHYIRIVGFGDVFDCGYHKEEHSLITGLIERWRPKTHTFYLLVGEVMVNLQDIQVLWGLAVDGGIVSGVDTQMTFEKLNNIYMQYLGFTSLPTSFKGNLLKLSTLLEVIETTLPDEPTDEVVFQRDRVYILHLIGGTLCPDSSASRVPILLPQNLVDLFACVGLSWGSTILAYLYKNLCNTSSLEANVGGSIVLLQLWAWERISSLAPKMNSFPSTENEGILL